METIRNSTLIFILVLLLGFSLIVLSYTLPTENAKSMITNNAKSFSDENRPSLIPDYPTTKLDMYTDSLILTGVVEYKNTSLIDNAMSNYDNGGGAKYLHEYASGKHNYREYSRYWHGNLVIYKLLFCFLDYNAIKILELFFEVVMILLISKLMIDNNLQNFIIPFILSIFFIHPEVIGLCLQYATMLNLMLISVFTLLKFKNSLFKGNRLIYYFLIIGMATSYFDLLTYPLISFGIPIIFYLLLNDDADIKKNITKIILFGAVWSIGYIGMWLCKWIIASILLNKNIILDAINEIMFRTSTSSPTEKFTKIDAILKNILIYKKRSYLIIMGLIAIYYIKRIVDLRKDITKNKIKQAIPFLLVALTPFVWYFITSNHSYIHFWFTYRELLIFFFAILCSLEYILIKKEVLTK